VLVDREVPLVDVMPSISPGKGYRIQLYINLVAYRCSYFNGTIHLVTKI
jgi:hypothetical protein